MAKTIDVRLNLRKFEDLRDSIDLDLRKSETQPLRRALNNAANQLLDYWRKRYKALMAGGGPKVWPKLKDKTIKDKERRGRARNPRYILHETDQIYNALRTKRIRKGIIIGFVEPGIMHTDPLGEHERVVSVQRLVEIHSGGEGRMPPRVVLNDPPQNVLKAIAKRVYDVGIAPILARGK